MKCCGGGMRSSYLWLISWMGNISEVYSTRRMQLSFQALYRKMSTITNFKMSIEIGWSSFVSSRLIKFKSLKIDLGCNNVLQCLWKTLVEGYIETVLYLHESQEASKVSNCSRFMTQSSDSLPGLYLARNWNLRFSAQRPFHRQIAIKRLGVSSTFLLVLVPKKALRNTGSSLLPGLRIIRTFHNLNPAYSTKAWFSHPAQQSVPIPTAWSMQNSIGW